MFRGIIFPAMMAAAFAQNAAAAGKKRPAPPAPKPMKRALRLDAIPNRFIELPDPQQSVEYYGSNIYERLIGVVEKSGDYAVLVGDDNPRSGVASSALSAAPLDGAVPPDPCIVDPQPIASSSVSIHVDELSFTTGSRGERTFYGFRRGAENPYNAGVDEKNRNEFPLRAPPEQPTWFDSEFADTGGLLTGLELGHELNFDVLFVGAKLKHAEYLASLGLDVVFANRFGPPVHKQLTTQGKGFYFDLSAHLTYQGADFMAGVMLARKTALLDAFSRTIDAAVAEIGLQVSRLPLVTRLAARCKGDLHVAAGANFRVPVGQRFYDLSQLNGGVRPAVFTVDEVYQRSARVAVDGEGYSFGDELVSLAPGEAPPSPKPAGLALLAASTAAPLAQNVDAGDVNFDVPAALGQFVEGFFARLWEGLKQLVTLPYRIYRYFQFDQDYKGGELWQVDAARAARLASSSWAHRAIGTPDVFKACIGSKDANCLGSRSVIVAVIDTGVDYNHEELRRNIFWDGSRDTPGFDFASGDPRPYDDHAHGTEVASAVGGGGGELVGAAPGVTLMPVKAFTPYGTTTSAALYSAFEYAVANGARVIVAGWGSGQRSRALEDGVRLAAANGVLVVAAAGDAATELGHMAYYPAALVQEFQHNVVVVAGMAEDGSLTRAKGLESNYGRFVELAAPGDRVRVADPRNSRNLRTHTGIAAGFVAGAAALGLSRCPKLGAAALKSALLDGARVSDALRGEVEGNRVISVPGMLSKIDQVCK
ncbi:MAG: S8 family serine peptidase [Deltaproteobacteria bacterium]|nr:S8 family serine peptidase [Deltaproteobacteria bacterium]